RRRHEEDRRRGEEDLSECGDHPARSTRSEFADAEKEVKRRYAAAVIAIIAVAMVAAAVWWSVRRLHHDLTTPAEKAVDLGDVVTQVREMSRLETAAMHVVNVSTITQSYK